MHGIPYLKNNINYTMGDTKLKNALYMQGIFKYFTGSKDIRLYTMEFNDFINYIWMDIVKR